MLPSPTRHRIALLIALLGVGVSVFTFVVHERIAARTGYTSFCNLGGVVNCDAVLASRYGTLLGLPVAAVGAAGFLAGAILALPGALGATSVGIADLLLLALVSGSLGFAAVLLVISVVILHHLCVLCLTLDAIILAWFITVAPLAARFDASARAGWWRRRAAARAIAAVGLLVAVAGGTWAAVRVPTTASTVEEVQSRDPKFYQWYTKLPVKPVADLIDGDCPRKGDPNAAVAIVEFSDFQCPYCVQAYRDLRDLTRGQPDVSLVFRHFPLDSSCNRNVKHSLHPDACLAACAAECAGQQGRFWEYHDVLFENHEHLERDSLFRYAREMALDVPIFRACLDHPDTRARIDQDVEAGTRAGVASTPTLFINGRTVEGALDRIHYDYALIIERHAHPAHGPAGAS
jgi:protein-disulfide isomerase/uncharacterized membrane protein